MMLCEKENLDGQERQRTSTASQETVVQASAMAGHAGRAQAAQDTTTTATVRASGVVARS